MSRNRRAILLIAYKYPPYAGVGGFRWAKLSKYLARLGHEVHVVTVPWSDYGPNVPAEAGGQPGVTVHPIPSGNPHRFRHRPLPGRWRPLARHFAFRALDRVRYYDDEAQRWDRHLLPACGRLIDEHGIEVVIATGHPFQANRWAAELKRRRPGLALIQDFRDPWADNPFHSLTARQRARVRDFQRAAVEAADAVVAVTPSLLTLYTGARPEARAVMIPNGVDPEDMTGVAAPRPAATGPLRLTHIGNVSNGRDRPLGALLDALRALPANAQAIEVALIGSGLDAIARLHPDLVEGGTLSVHPPVAHRDALRRVAESHYALQLNAREFPYGLSTKVYEYALLRVPTISVNYGGDIDALVRERGFGHSLDLSGDADLAGLLRSLPARAAEDRNGRFAFDVERFTHPALADEYSALIGSV